jgi:hypothetical protein
MTTDEFFEVAIAGAAAGGMAVGLVALQKSGWPPEAVLGFFGAVVGSFLAIAGAIWSEGLRSRRARAGEAKHLCVRFAAHRQTYLRILAARTDDDAPFSSKDLSEVRSQASVTTTTIEAAFKHAKTLDLMDVVQLEHTLRTADLTLQAHGDAKAADQMVANDAQATREKAEAYRSLTKCLRLSEDQLNDAINKLGEFSHPALLKLLNPPAPDH